MSNTDVGLEDDDFEIPEDKTLPPETLEEGDEIVGDDETPDTEEPEDLPQAKQPSRSERRVQAVLAREKEKDAENQKLMQELAAERAKRQLLEEMRQPKVDPAYEAEQLAQMDPEERMAYTLRKSEMKFERQLSEMSFRNQDLADKAAFQAIIAADPRLAKYTDDVDKEMQRMWNSGQNAPREAVLKYVIGEAVMKSKAKTTKQIADAKRNVDRQKVAPVAAKGDQGRGTPSKNTREALRERLKNIPI